MAEESPYTKALSSLWDFNSKSFFLAQQMTNFCGAVTFPSVFSTVDELTKKYKNIFPLENSLLKLDPKSISFPVLQFSREANIAMSRFAADSHLNFEPFITSINTASWLKDINPLTSHLKSTTDSLNGMLSFLNGNKADLLKLSDFAIQSNFAKISQISLCAEKSLSFFDMTDLGKTIGFDLCLTTGIQESFLRVADSYSSLFKTLHSLPDKISNIEPSTLRHTAIEYFNEVDLCRSISIDAPVFLEEKLIQNDIVIENELDLHHRLPTVGSDLLRIWEGAKKALKSDNPDKIRHFSVSIRELITQVMHALAPDEEIKKWATDKAYFHNNRPTRRARLMYICRNMYMDDLRAFVEKDVNATLEFMDLFEQGTHKIRSSTTDMQLMALKAKAESTIRYIIEISQMS